MKNPAILPRQNYTREIMFTWGGVSMAKFFLFFKNHFNKNVEAEICPQI